MNRKKKVKDRKCLNYSSKRVTEIMAPCRPVFLATLTLLSVLLSLQGSLATDPFCQREPSVPDLLHIDVFTELVSNHTDIASTIRTAPLIGNMDPNAPAFEFRGTGIHITDQHLSDSIRRQSCMSNEVSLFGSVFFKDSQSSGTLLELSYSDRDDASFPAFGMYMDASADEVTVAYRHLGGLRTEIFSTRLHSGKWRTYGVTLSGNQISFYVNCDLAYQRIVPLPDYCANDSSLMLSVADSRIEGFENGMFAFLQNVGVQFGHGGMLNQCPDLSPACPSCGQFIQLVEKVYLLNQEVEVLKRRVLELENREVPDQPECETATTPSVGSNCTRTVNGETSTFSNGSLLSFTDQMVCYCDDGIYQCTESTDVCKNGSVNVVEPATTTIGQDSDTGLSTTEPPVPSCFIDELQIPLRAGAMASEKEGQSCTVYACENGRFGLQSNQVAYRCSANYSVCASSFTDIQVEVSKCCRICNVCDFVTCAGDDSVCVVDKQNNNLYSCQCKPGFKSTGEDSCVDVNECEVNPSACPTDSVCNNTEGSFQCVCNKGYNMVVSSNQQITCGDDDECASPETNDCPTNTICINNNGSYTCECPEGNQLTPDGGCTPFCDPPCQNGGQCMSGGTCTCHRGYKGRRCESDINECESSLTNNCNHPMSQCINTVGGFFCRCEEGFQGNGEECEDIDECANNLDKCISGSRCFNTFGSYRCICSGGNICTGSCMRKGVTIANRDSMLVDKCRNCTCIEGELSCRRQQCDCSTNPDQKCCPQCYRRDCVIKEGTVRIRPRSTWINPENRCERYFCEDKKSVLVPVRTDLAANCPAINCPANLTMMPMGKCCPVCLLQPCTEENNKQFVTIRNGCRTCTCLNSEWKCQQRMQCPEVQCNSQDILFSEDGCCPVCASQALNAMCDT